MSTIKRRANILLSRSLKSNIGTIGTTLFGIKPKTHNILNDGTIRVKQTIVPNDIEYHEWSEGLWSKVINSN